MTAFDPAPVLSIVVDVVLFIVVIGAAVIGLIYTARGFRWARGDVGQSRRSGLCGENGWCHDCEEVTAGTTYYACAVCGSDHWSPGEDPEAGDVDLSDEVATDGETGCDEDGWCHSCEEVTAGTSYYTCAQCGTDHWSPGESHA